MCSADVFMAVCFFVGTSRLQSLLYTSGGAGVEAMGDYFLLPQAGGGYFNLLRSGSCGDDGMGYDSMKGSWKTPSSSSMMISLSRLVDGSNCRCCRHCCGCCCRCCCVCLRVRMNGDDGVEIFCDTLMHFRAGSGGGGKVTFR